MNPAFLSISRALFLLFALTPLLASPEFCNAQAREAQVHADRGLELARSGELQPAEDELRQAVKLEPSNPEFLSTLATLLAMDKKLDESTVVLRKALLLDPQNNTTRRYLAANLWQLHHYSEAKQQLQILLRQQPNDAPSRLLMGMVAENSGDYATAAKMLSSVPDEVAKQPESIIALARSYYHLQERDKARSALAQLRNNSADGQPILLGAQIADRAGDFDEAQKLLEAIRNSVPDTAVVEYHIALVQYHANHFAESQATLQHLIDSGTRTAEAYNLLGWCYHRQNNQQSAVEALKKAIALAPEEESNYLDLGSILLEHSSLPAALDVARRAATRFPNSAAVFDFKGLNENRMSQYTDAIRSYEHAFELDPSDKEAVLGLSRAQAGGESTSAAKSTLESAMTRFPKDPRFRVAYAELLLKEANAGKPGANARAEQMLKAALAIDSSNSQALYELGNLELNDGRLADACKNLEQAVKFSPQSSPAHFALARAYRRLKRTEDAAREMDQYNKLKGSDSQEPAN